MKVYAVGTEYAHAEARKAPTLDGKVQRDSGGNEVSHHLLSFLSSYRLILYLQVNVYPVVI